MKIEMMMMESIQEA